MTRRDTPDSSDSIFGEGDGLLDQILDRLRSGEDVDEESLEREYPEQADQIPQLIQLVGFVHGASTTVHPGSDLDGQLALGVQPKVGDYILQRLVSRGGMGAVYEALDPALERTVAIKFLESRSAQGSHAHKRFEREARSASKLNHAHIVPIYSVGEHEGVPYYAMRFIEGASLAQIRKERDACKQAGDTPYYRRVATWIRDIAEALAHAHEGGVIHRDVKPSNILIDKDGTAHLADFGLARDESDATLTQSGKLIGTLRYMSPEQARGGSALDERTDVYSLGATLFELLSGQPIFADEERSAMLNQVLTQDPQHLSTTHPGLPAELVTITHKALAKHRENRFQSAALLAQDLDNFLAARPIQARPLTLREQFNALDKRSKRVVRWALVAIGVIVLLVGIASTQAFRLSADRDRLADETERATKAKNFLVGVLFQANPKSSHRAYNLDEMLDAVALGLNSEFTDDPTTEAELHYRLADVYWTRSRLKEADLQLRLAAERGAIAEDIDPSWVTHCLIQRASLLNLLGQHEQAMNLLDGILKESPEAAQWAFYLETRATSLALLGRTEEAKSAMAAALLSYENQPDKNAWEKAASQEKAAEFFSDLGEIQSAIDAQRKALALFAQLLESDNDTVSLARCKLASALSDMGTSESFHEAETLLTLAISNMASQQDVAVTDLAWAKGILARNAARMGKKREAEELFQEVTSTLEHELGDHLLVAESKLSYGQFLISEKRASEAIPYLAQSSKIRRRLLGPNNPSTKESEVALVEARSLAAQTRGLPALKARK